MHDRAHRIMSDGDTPKDVAYAVATQQAHATKKSPKDFKTAKGVRVAKRKYDEPKTYQKTAEATKLATLYALLDELGQIEKEAGWFRNLAGGAALLAATAGGVKAATPAYQRLASNKPVPTMVSNMAKVIRTGGPARTAAEAAMNVR